MALRLICTLIAGLLLTACPKNQEQNPEPKPLPEAVRLEVGKSALFGFPADGQWNPSPVVVQNGDKMVIRAATESKGLQRDAIYFRIGKMPQLLGSGSPFSVTTPGRLEFRVDPKKVDSSVTGAAVEIERVE